MGSSAVAPRRGGRGPRTRRARRRRATCCRPSVAGSGPSCASRGRAGRRAWTGPTAHRPATARRPRPRTRRRCRSSLRPAPAPPPRRPGRGDGRGRCRTCTSRPRGGSRQPSRSPAAHRSDAPARPRARARAATWAAVEPDADGPQVSGREALRRNGDRARRGAQGAVGHVAEQHAPDRAVARSPDDDEPGALVLGQPVQPARGRSIRRGKGRALTPVASSSAASSLLISSIGAERSAGLAARLGSRSGTCRRRPARCRRARPAPRPGPVPRGRPRGHRRR